jgi:hypothetical protein
MIVARLRKAYVEARRGQVGSRSCVTGVRLPETSPPPKTCFEKPRRADHPESRMIEASGLMPRRSRGSVTLPDYGAPRQGLRSCIPPGHLLMDLTLRGALSISGQAGSRRDIPIVARLRKAYVATARRAVLGLRAVEARRSLRRRPGTKCLERRTPQRNRPEGHGLIGDERRAVDMWRREIHQKMSLRDMLDMSSFSLLCQV